MSIKIENISYYLPKKTLDNDHLTSLFKNFDVDKIENKVGIKSRQVIDNNETCLDLAFNAAVKVLEDTDKTTIDFVILCTQTPDYILPTGACILQDKLGLKKSTGALDFNLGCSGYVYGLAICTGLLEAKIASKILFITADSYTAYIHEKDKGNRSIFGDGAAACILSRTDNQTQKFVLGTDGSGYDKLIIKNGGGKNKYNENEELLSYGDDNFYTNNCIYMNGPEIFNFTIKNIPGLITETLESSNLKVDDVDYFVFHQANKFMLNYLRKKTKIPEAKFHINLKHTGNTVSSTIPIALNQALTEGKIKEGDKVLLAGFGVGLSWGATIITI